MTDTQSTPCALCWTAHPPHHACTPATRPDTKPADLQDDKPAQKTPDKFQRRVIKSIDNAFTEAIASDRWPTVKSLAAALTEHNVCDRNDLLELCLVEVRKLSHQSANQKTLGQAHTWTAACESVVQKLTALKDDNGI